MKSRPRELDGLDVIFSEGAEEAIEWSDVRRCWKIIEKDWEACAQPMRLPNGRLVPYFPCISSEGEPFFIMLSSDARGGDYWIVGLPRELNEAMN